MLTLSTVPVPPKMVGETQRNVQAVLGDDVYLPCNVKGDPQPTIMWQKGTSILTSGAGNFVITLYMGCWMFSSGEIKSSENWVLLTEIFCHDMNSDYYIMTNGTLLLRRTDERDTGMYICIARNNAGTAMSQIFLRMFSEWISYLHVEKMITSDDVKRSIISL
jgi:hypothetical protein